jgi:molybdate transport system substrate-binding protein
MRTRFLLLVCMLAVAAQARPADPETENLRIAVAANFSQPLLQLILAYASETGETAVASSASTGVLYTQIRHGAPFDLFLAADSEHPTLLVESGHALAGSQKTYALGKLVLAYRESLAPQSPGGVGAVLTQPGLTLAIANPELAPYGRAAREVLARFPVTPQLLTGTNVSQALQMWASGGADAALVAASYRPGHYLVIPEDWYTPIEQQAVILSTSARQQRARAFLDWLTGPTGRRLVTGLGYGVPDD